MVGSNALFSGESYIGIGRETTLGTYATATASIDFLSSSIKVLKDSKILQQIERSRTMSKHFSLGKTIEGDIQFYPSVDITATAFIMQNAFGGPEVTSLTATGESIGGSAITHTFNTGSFTGTYGGLSINQRKGDATNGFVFQYEGGRVNNFALSAELDEPLVATASMVFKDSTQVSNDIESALTSTAFEVLSFINGRFSVETAFASLTTTSYWNVQNINFTMNNNLKNDANSRRIGTDTLDVLPIGIQSFELSCQVRFDTTTAYDAMIAATELAGEFEFLGTTLSSSVIRRGMKFRFPKLTIKDAGDPEISGPDETLVSTITFNVLRDDSSATGYAVRAELTNTDATI